MKRIAVTGAIAAGKSTVCTIFKELGAYVVSADQIVHELLTKPSIQTQLINLFGHEVILDKTVDRSALAKRAFANEANLQKLEQLLHPKVFSSLKWHYTEAKKDATCPLFVAEIPLLYETHHETQFDYVIVVDCDPSSAKQRSSMITDDYSQRSKRLLPIDQKKAKANFVIDNSGSVNDLCLEVKKIFNQIK